MIVGKCCWLVCWFVSVLVNGVCLSWLSLFRDFCWVCVCGSRLLRGSRLWVSSLRRCWLLCVMSCVCAVRMVLVSSCAVFEVLCG